MVVRVLFLSTRIFDPFPDASGLSGNHPFYGYIDNIKYQDPEDQVGRGK